MPASKRDLMKSGSQRLWAMVQTILVCLVYIVFSLVIRKLADFGWGVNGVLEEMMADD